MKELGFEIEDNILSVEELYDYNYENEFDDYGVEINDVFEKRCPICGGELVERIARQGIYSGERFYGCSNFPSCTYIETI